MVFARVVDFRRFLQKTLPEQLVAPPADGRPMAKRDMGSENTAKKPHVAA
ncbi:MAG TPA: hypothetical protein VGM76_13650 [Lacipirellulaceae bacterium]|jgi:hypothetical protein